MPADRARPIEAVIFDLDGVLVDSEPAHRTASRRLVAPAVITDEEYARFVGASLDSYVAWVRERYAPVTTEEELAARYTELVEIGRAHV